MRDEVAIELHRHDGTPVWVKLARIVLWYPFEAREDGTTIVHKLVRVVIDSGSHTIELDVIETLDEISEIMTSGVHNEG